MASITRAWQFCVDACNASNVFYSMDTTGSRQRTLYNNPYGPPYYCDCSSLMCYAVLAGGFTMSGYDASTKAPFDTYAEPDALKSAGWVDIGIPSEFRPGDIGHSYASERSEHSSGHTEMCYKGGSKSEAVFMGAHMNYGNTARDVSINDYTGSDFRRYFRYEGEDDETGLDNPTNRVQCPFPVAAAIAGNFYQESGINPGIWEFHDGRGFDKTTLLNGFGLGQWTNTGGDTHGRLYQLLDWLDNHGYGWTSGSGQVAYLCEEKTWQTYFNWQSQFGINSFDEFLYNNSEDIEMLTRAWCYCWEGVSEDTVSFDIGMPTRIEKAKYYYDYIQKHLDDESINSWYAFDGYTNDSQRENNAVMLYKGLNNYTMANGSTVGDSGNTHGGNDGTPQPAEVSFDDFLMSLLGRSNSGGHDAIHIKNKPRGKD